MTEKTALEQLPDSRAFDRDPEKWDNESLADAEKRLTKIRLRYAPQKEQP